MNENKGIMTVMFKHKHIQKRVRFRFLLIALIMDDNFIPILSASLHKKTGPESEPQPGNEEGLLGCPVGS